MISKSQMNMKFRINSRADYTLEKSMKKLTSYWLLFYACFSLYIIEKSSQLCVFLLIFKVLKSSLALFQTSRIFHTLGCMYAKHCTVKLYIHSFCADKDIMHFFVLFAEWILLIWILVTRWSITVKFLWYLASSRGQMWYLLHTIQHNNYWGYTTHFLAHPEP